MPVEYVQTAGTQYTLIFLCDAVSKLVTPKGDILIPGVKEMIVPVTEDERRKFEAIHVEMKVCELKVY